MLAVLWQEWPQLVESLGRASIFWLVLAFAISLLASLFYVGIWHFAGKSLGGSGSYPGTFIIVSVAGVARYLPGGIWPLVGMAWQAEAVRLKKRTVPALAVMAQGSHLGVAGWLAVSGLTVFLPAGELWRKLLLIPLAAALLAGWPLIYSHYLLPLLKKFGLVSNPATAPARQVAGVEVASVIVWTLGGLRLAALVATFHPGIFAANQPALLFFFIIAGALAGLSSSLFFFVPLGLGAVEVSLGTLLSLVVNDWPALLAVLLLNRTLQVVNDLVFISTAPAIKKYLADKYQTE